MLQDRTRALRSSSTSCTSCSFRGEFAFERNGKALPIASIFGSASAVATLYERERRFGSMTHQRGPDDFRVRVGQARANRIPSRRPWRWRLEAPPPPLGRRRSSSPPPSHIPHPPSSVTLQLCDNGCEGIDGGFEDGEIGEPETFAALEQRLDHLLPGAEQQERAI